MCITTGFHLVVRDGDEASTQKRRKKNGRERKSGREKESRRKRERGEEKVGEDRDLERGPT